MPLIQPPKPMYLEQILHGGISSAPRCYTNAGIEPLLAVKWLAILRLYCLQATCAWQDLARIAFPSTKLSASCTSCHKTGTEHIDRASHRSTPKISGVCSSPHRLCHGHSGLPKSFSTAAANARHDHIRPRDYDSQATARFAHFVEFCRPDCHQCRWGCS